MKKLIFTVILILLLTPMVYAQSSNRPYVILISFDGFRWDYPDRGLTPNLEKMAREGVRALSLEPVFPSKTFPNHYSMVTGLYPENHGIIYNDFVDPFNGLRYKVGDTTSVRNARWYLGEALWETAERQGIRTASFFWPGSEVHLSYRHPSYFKYYDGKVPYRARVDTVLAWLRLPEAQRPHFITLYFDASDTEGHRYGPNSPELNRAIERLDQTLGYLLNGVAALPIGQQVNVVVVSDHGMTRIDSTRTVAIETGLEDLPHRIQGYGPLVMISAADSLLPKIYQRLRERQNHYRVYRRDEMPTYFHFSRHPFIPALLVVAEIGWSLLPDHFPGAYLSKARGNHGYDNHHLDMHGIFFAVGPAFKNGYRCGTLRNIDLYPLICRILGIMPRENIDGTLERIEFILKNGS